MNIIFKQFLLAFILLASFPLQASDFIFEVPVKINQIPKGIPQAKIVCDVFGNQDNTQPIASGYSIRPIASHRGELVDIVQISVNYISIKRHISPHSYQCRLLLLTPWAKPAWQEPGPEAVEEAIRPQPDTHSVTLVEGIIRTQ